MPVQIQHRRGTAAAWTAANPVLADGEVGIETDTGKEKCGNGATAWNSLAYRSHAAAGITFVPAGTITSTTVQTAIEEVASEAGAGSGIVPVAVKKRYVMPAAAGGSDAADGRSWATAYATVAAAIIALGGNSGQGDVYLGPGTHAWTDTIILGQGVRLRGVEAVSAAAGGSELLWTGADDGRDGLVTSSSSSADWTRGLIENIYFNGGTSNQSGGGNCLNIRNMQNGSRLENVHVVGWDTGNGIRVSSTMSAGSGYPGYAYFDNVWSSCGTLAGWDIDGPMTNLLFTNCGSDPQVAQGTLRSWIVRGTNYPYGAAVNKTITSSSSSGSVATHVCTGHGLSVGYFVDISGTSVSGYHGVFRVATVPDANTFTVNTGAVTGLGAATGGTAVRTSNGDRGTLTFVSCKTESANAGAGWEFRGSSGIVLIGCAYFEQTANAGGVAFNYLGPIHNASGDIEPAPRVSLIDCITQSMEYSFAAPFFGINIAAEEGYTAGRFNHISFSGRSNVMMNDFMEIADPQLPLANNARLYARDNGSGKTQLVVVFASGAVQVIATQP